MEAVFRKPRLLRALTSLDAGEFARLLAAFEQEVQARRGRFNRFGQERQRAPGATGNAGVLSTSKARLFFVLFYFKCQPDIANQHVGQREGRVGTVDGQFRGLRGDGQRVERDLPLPRGIGVNGFRLTREGDRNLLARTGRPPDGNGHPLL